MRSIGMYKGKASLQDRLRGKAANCDPNVWQTITSEAADKVDELEAEVKRLNGIIMKGLRG